MSVEAILTEIEALTEAEREHLFERLAERHQPHAVPEMTPELAALLDARNAAYEANPDAGYTMEEVVAYVKRKK